MNFEAYIMPELAVLIPVLLALGWAIKKIVKHKYIPVLLMGIGIVFAIAWCFATNGITLMSVWIGATQGILCAAGAVFAHQLFKQHKKGE